MTWRDQAECRKPGLDVVFEAADDTRGRPPADGNTDIRAAKAVCRACEVTQECLQAALDEEGVSGPHDRYSVRGGLSNHERWQLRGGAA